MRIISDLNYLRRKERKPPHTTRFPRLHLHMKLSNSLRVREYRNRLKPPQFEVGGDFHRNHRLPFFSDLEPPHTAIFLFNCRNQRRFQLAIESAEIAEPPYTSPKSLDSLKSEKIPAEMFGSSVAIAVFFKLYSHGDRAEENR